MDAHAAGCDICGGRILVVALPAAFNLAEFLEKIIEVNGGAACSSLHVIWVL